MGLGVFESRRQTGFNYLRLLSDPLGQGKHITRENRPLDPRLAGSLFCCAQAIGSEWGGHWAGGILTSISSGRRRSTLHWYRGTN
jgi:hypothetical protein